MTGLIKACDFDYISIVARNLAEDVYPQLDANIEDVAYRLANLYRVDKSRVMWSSDKYSKNIRLPLFSEYVPGKRNPETPHLYLQHAPSRLRMELKGHPLTLQHYLCARTWLAILLGKYEKEALQPENLISTAADVATDIRCTIESLAFDHRRSQVSGAFYGRAGKLQTQYIGASRSGRKWTVYDRCAKHKKFKLPVSEEPITRIELRTKMDASLDNLPATLKLEECFEAFYIYDLNAIAKSGILPQYLAHLIGSIGLKPILQSMHDSERRRLRKKIEPFMLQLIPVSQVKEAISKSMGNVSYLYRDSRLVNWRIRNTRKSFKEVYGFDSL